MQEGLTLAGVLLDSLLCCLMVVNVPHRTVCLHGVCVLLLATMDCLCVSTVAMPSALLSGLCAETLLKLLYDL